MIDHPYTDPGDGRSECQTCRKWVWPIIHSCGGVPVRMDFDNANVYPGYIRGYRKWYTNDNGIWSVFYSAPCWTTRNLKAECFQLVKHTEVPYPRCNCGIHAFHRPGNARKYRPSLRVYPLGIEYFDAASRLIFGVISGYGRVLIHEHGFRAEKARIEAVVVGDDASVYQRRAVGILQDAGVRIFPTVPTLLEEYPAQRS